VVSVNVRIIAATNRNLETDIASGRFRPDLFYRLNVFPLSLPPLRDRGSDIILLADHFIAKYAQELGKPVKKISTSVLEIFLSYQWPGNVRELENCIERAVLVATEEVIESLHLPPTLQLKRRDGERKDQGKFGTIIEAQERSLIIDALKETRGNQSQAAKMLGTTKRIVQYKIQKFGLDPRRFRLKNDSPQPVKGRN
jgi:Nif-specific regulatory protein